VVRGILQPRLGILLHTTRGVAGKLGSHQCDTGSHLSIAREDPQIRMDPITLWFGEHCHDAKHVERVMPPQILVWIISPIAVGGELHEKVVEGIGNLDIHGKCLAVPAPMNGTILDYQGSSAKGSPLSAC